MTACHYSDILQQAAQLCGLSYSRTVGASGLSADEEAQLRVSLNNELQALWPLAKWPWLVRCEERTYRAAWDSATAYTAGTIVFFPQEEQYYQALRASTGEEPADSSGTLNSAYWAVAVITPAGADYSATTAYSPGDAVYYPVTDTYYQCHTASTGNVPTNTSYWGALVPFETYVSLTQTGETAIGEVLDVWDLSPRRTTQARRVRWELNENGILCVDGPARVWVEFKIPVPSIVGEVYSASATYAVGDQVQFETNTGNVAFLDFYNCVTATSAGESPTSAAAKWSRVEIPDEFKGHLAARCAVLFSVGENDARFAVAQAEAMRAWDALVDRLYRSQHQVPRTVVETY